MALLIGVFQMLALDPGHLAVRALILGAVFWAKFPFCVRSFPSIRTAIPAMGVSGVKILIFLVAAAVSPAPSSGILLVGMLVSLYCVYVCDPFPGWALSKA